MKRLLGKISVYNILKNETFSTLPGIKKSSILSVMETLHDLLVLSIEIM